MKPNRVNGFSCIWIVIIFETIIQLEFVSGETQIWMATWNVADNKKMSGGLTYSAMEQVLGLKNQTDLRLADIYVVALQENCHKCNSNNKNSLAEEFIAILNKASKDMKLNKKYVAINSAMTRESSFCQSLFCLPKVSQHGTASIMVLAIENLVQSSSTTKNINCKVGFKGNEEKGVAGVKLQLQDGKQLCFAGLHIDSGKRTARMFCMNSFLTSKDFQNIWAKQCSLMFLMGDFNTRTKFKLSVNSKGGIVTDKDLLVMKASDEMHVADENSPALLSYINTISNLTFSELDTIYNMSPTYKTLACEIGESICYRADKNPSWTDRIICAGCEKKIVKYKVLSEMYKFSDHIPVIGTVTV